MNKFQPNWNSLHEHKIPQWYDDAKLGIFIHWGLYSVPAYAPHAGELGTIPDTQWYIKNPYAEWYYNSVNVGEGPTYEHHIKTYGKDFAYENFADMWNAENWDPDEWADLFYKAGAKYVVLTTKHHDGFCLYPSKYTDYTSVNRGPKRDITGELAEAVRKRGMRFGCYYSPLIDWRFMDEPIYTDWECHNFNCPTYEYADYAFKQWKELVDYYKPDVMWNDIGWPIAGEGQLPYLLAHYYNTCPDGVTNDRYNDLWHDFWCKEYQQGSVHTDEKWEMTRGLSQSFGYNTEDKDEDALSGSQLTELLTFSVGNNGNLLINVGPMADGTIPKLQKDSLLGMGGWLDANKDAIFNTRPEYPEGFDTQGGDVRFTSSNGRHFMIVSNVSGQPKKISGINKKAVPLDKTLNAVIKQDGADLYISCEDSKGYPVALELV